MHTPEFSRRGAVVMNSPYWSDARGNPGDADFPERNAKVREQRSNLQDSIMEASDYDDLEPDMKLVFDAAESAAKTA